MPLRASDCELAGRNQVASRENDQEKMQEMVWDITWQNRMLLLVIHVAIESGTDPSSSVR
jgi:hypothetical protein